MTFKPHMRPFMGPIVKSDQRHPEPLFGGYYWRFGEVRACFENAAMQALSGSCPPIRTKEQPSILWVTYGWLANDVAERKAAGLDWEWHQRILDCWPHNAVVGMKHHLPAALSAPWPSANVSGKSSEPKSNAKTRPAFRPRPAPNAKPVAGKKRLTRPVDRPRRR
jgi:hypothetical protein